MKILLIVPCFNEEKRLQLQEFISFDQADFLFADDGSTDKTFELIQSAQDNKHIFSFQSKKNLGKSHIIQAAFKDFKLKSNYDLIGYWDADLAAPLEEITTLLNCLLDNDVVYGSRKPTLSSTIKRRRIRHYPGRVFAFIIRRLFKIKFYDTQCGAKIFKKEAFETAFEKPLLTNWIFDVEILLRLKDKKIIECPLGQWIHVSGNKVNIIKDLPGVIKDLIRLKLASRQKDQ